MTTALTNPVAFSCGYRRILMTWKTLCLAASVVAVVLFACGSFIALPSALFFSSTAKV